MTFQYPQDIKIRKLDNGITLITEKVPYVPTIHLKAVFNVGSMDEFDPRTFGIAHFVEHMMFTGTSKYDEQYLNNLELFGMERGGSTSIESTTFPLTYLPENQKLAIDTLGNVFSHTKFNQHSIETERKIITQEYYRQRDASPFYDGYNNSLLSKYSDHPNLHGSIGTYDGIQNITRNDLMTFHHQYYTPKNLIISAAGSLDHGEMLDNISHAFADLKGSENKNNYMPPICKRSLVKQQIDTVSTVQCFIERAAIPLDSELDNAFSTLTSCYGEGAASILYKNIRSGNTGLSYDIGASVNFIRYDNPNLQEGFTCEAENIPSILEKLSDSWKEIPITLTQNRLKQEKIKQTFIFKDAISNPWARTNFNMNNYNIFGRPLLINDKIKQIYDVTHDECMATYEHLSEQDISVVAMGAVEQFPDYDTVKDILGVKKSATSFEENKDSSLTVQKEPSKKSNFNPNID